MERKFFGLEPLPSFIIGVFVGAVLATAIATYAMSRV